MDTVIKSKETQITNYGNPSNVQTSANAIKMSSNENFNSIPVPLHDLVNANSTDLNTAASLSDDSGIPLTTNSSISSGDSYRLGLCKYGNELAESDGEASQFDSLDNCSEGGMSGENFNTLKKGPLAPIDPPPEFQDSPESTIRQTFSRNSLRRWTSSHSSYEHLKDHIAQEVPNIKNCLIPDTTVFKELDKNLKEIYTTNKHLYSSDSILNSYTDNIYDEPNNILSSSLGNSIDGIDSDVSSSCQPPAAAAFVKIKEAVCPHFDDHTRYFKAIPSAQDNITKAGQNVDKFGLELNDYNLFNPCNRGQYQQQENNSQRKFLPSPLCHSFYCHHYQGGNGCNNRPNSRNSLNSRLSSSHNSLSVSSNNKPDDSIFITQAMSHDALLSREISDFYNVPIDSDIYAFPIDMIQSEKSISMKMNIVKSKCAKKSETLNSDLTFRQEKLGSRHKRKKKHLVELKNEYNDQSHNTINENKTARKSGNTQIMSSNSSFLSNDTSMKEPFHMTLDEVKQFYQTIYSEKTLFHEKLTKDFDLSNDSIWSTTKSKDKNVAYEIKTSRTVPKFNSKVNTITSNENINNNNIDSLISTSIPKNKIHNADDISSNDCSNDNSENTKPIINEEKRSQFSLNLKQRFCSIFRFRRSQNRFRSLCTPQNNQAKETENCITLRTTDDKRKKFQSRALPPLPKKIGDQKSSTIHVEETRIIDMKRQFQFTSSIEKVKDYGWYWGPLSSEAAEKVLSNEPDGSFIVRDSSDDHYIFSLSFKLNNCVRHVRIEQDQGTFSFGSYAKFKSQTITEFIEKAVDHSRSGRYLFFLHRRPEHGPMRVQLTNPVSRFKHVQSLQHMCRFVILKAVIRKDLIQTLPLPRRLLDYLNYKHCYSEQVESDCSHSQTSDEGPF